MPETIGLLIIVGAGELGAPIGAAAAGFTFGATGISLGTVVGATAIIGLSIGLQYALNNPNTPKPETGSKPIKQAVPPRIRGYGRNRLAGYYMLFEAGGPPPARSYDVIAFHAGRIGQIVGQWLSDDWVTTTPALTTQAPCLVDSNYADGRYFGNRITIEARLGNSWQSAASIIVSDPYINGVWNSTFQGNDIAWAAMVCAPTSNPEQYTRVFPKGHPELSVLCDCSPCWDPRLPGQNRLDPSTWAVSFNPVIQLIDYLCRVDGGMGKDYDRIIAPVLAAWMAEADLCDQEVATASGVEARYASHGWFQYDNAPENVIGNLLATCDGWLAESGDGTLSIVVGVYREPALAALTETDITAFALNYGETDEELVNELAITFTDPGQKFVSVQTEPWRDEASISAVGTIKSKALDLQWVQSNSQARRLADRAMQRLNADMSGSFTTSLYGLAYLGQRWVRVQYPFVSGLQDCVVEIQDADVDLMAGRINWKFLRIDTGAIEAYDPEADEGTAPPVPPSNVQIGYVREDGNILLRETGVDAYIREESF